MAEKILLAMDDSENSLKAVDYVAKGMQPTASVTLFSVIPEASSACGLDSPSLSPIFKDNIKTFCAMEDRKKDVVKVSMEKAKQLLVQSGFPSKDVKIKIQKRKVGIARDILKEAQHGKYDTLVIGRRGLSGIKQFVLGSISNKVVQLAQDVSVIVVD